MAWTRKSIFPHVCLHRREYRVDAGRIGDVAMADDNAADFLRQRFDALFQRFALIGEGQFRALGATGFGDAPGQRRWLATPMIRPRLPA